MSYNNTKTTSRFQFGISRNSTAKKAGSNVVTISTLPASVWTSEAPMPDTATRIRESISQKGFRRYSCGFTCALLRGWGWSCGIDHVTV